MNSPTKRFLNIKFIFSICILFTLLFFSNCKSKKKIQKTNPNITQSNETGNTTDSIYAKCKIDFKSAKTLSSLLKQNEFTYSSMLAKYDVNYQNGQDEYDFDIEVRTIKDSIIWINATYILGVNVARIYITPDSVKMVMHLPSKKYFKGDYAYLSKLLQTEVDFEILQALFSGNSARFYEEDNRLNPGRDKDSCLYTLSTIKKRFIRRVVSGESQVNEPTQILWINPIDFKIKQNSFIDARSLRKFTINYSDYKAVNDKLYPHQSKATIEPNGYQKIFVNINCKRIETEKGLSFPFNIPSKYEPIIK
jgi:Domain of unknown function (DUF4292)